MKIFANVVFYLLLLITLASVVTILVSREAKIYITGAIIAFTSIAGLYILLKSPVMFVAQLVFFALGTGSILLFGINNFKPERKSTFNLNVKTVFSLFLLALFVFLSTPFLIQQIKSRVISTFCIEQTFVQINSFVSLVLILFLIIIITVLSGFYTVAFWRKK